MQWVDASTITISWTDQKHELLTLTPSVHLPGIKSCTFIATLEHDNEGGAVIVGCIDSEVIWLCC